jgi:hypothetical protein
MPGRLLEVSSGDINAFVTEMSFCLLAFHLADGLVRPSLVLKALIIRHDTNCFLGATSDLVN